MRIIQISKHKIPKPGLEGAFWVLAFFPFLFTIKSNHEFSFLNLGFASAATGSILFIVSGFIISKKTFLAKSLAAMAGFFSFLAGFQSFSQNPFLALTALISLIAFLFFVADFDVTEKDYKKTSKKNIALAQVKWASITAIPVSAAIIASMKLTGLIMHGTILFLSAAVMEIIFLRWSFIVKERESFFLYPTMALFFILIIAYSFASQTIHYSIILMAFINLLVLPEENPFFSKKDKWFNFIIDHPERVLVFSFLLLIVSGTFLLGLNISSQSQQINLIDAAFTSVSAVCVTGLAVLDTQTFFSHAGQFFIIILIQLGGLGIMSITAISLQIMGKRISLKQELILSSMTNTDKKDISYAIIIILKFTFFSEIIGGLILSALFIFHGDTFFMGLWRGFFTSISAFCNAGFSLQTESLINYSKNPLILHTIALLIIAGGTAPASAILIPCWIKKQKVPVSPSTAFKITIALLLIGTAGTLIFEWNGMLKDLSVLDKFHNAWFQSATLRTAGFNAVDISRPHFSFFMIMLVLMFIGGNPGGTAGGVKTTTAAVLGATFWCNILNKNEVTIHNRQISQETINKAVTIVISGILTWLAVVIMLQLTQQIPISQIIFEASSALGTVGLTIGATPKLDQIGKIIIMFAMFAGRVGPMTLFMILSNQKQSSSIEYPRANITLT